MKRFLLLPALLLLTIPAMAQQFKMITTVESIIPMGLGRSRMLESTVGNTAESEMKNFYSAAGINFGNIMENDQSILKKIDELTKAGWNLVSVANGVQSPSEKNSQGIFITRYLFRKD